MIESLMVLSLLSTVACATALYMDRLDRIRVLNETNQVREELKSLIEKLGTTHNELILAMKDVNNKMTSMDMRITAVAAASAASGPQAFRGVR